jgi:hypothetical protein
VIGGIVLLAVGGGGGSSGSDKPAASQVKSLQNQVLQHTVVNHAAGISVRRPANWVDTHGKDLISLRSHDSCVAMTLATPPHEATPGHLLNDSLVLLKRSYQNVHAQKVQSGQVGGIPTTTYTVDGPRDGTPIRIVLSVGKGKSHAYLTEVVLQDPSCQGAVQRAQVILSSVQYTK